jgi:hypothetical protein
MALLRISRVFWPTYHWYRAEGLVPSYSEEK